MMHITLEYVLDFPRNKKENHLCSGAQGGKLVRHKITVASNSSTTGRKADDDDLLNGLPSKGVSHQLVDHVRHDVLPVEVEVGCLRRRVSVTRVLVAAAVRHPHLGLNGLPIK